MKRLFIFIPFFFIIGIGGSMFFHWNAAKKPVEIPVQISPEDILDQNTNVTPPSYNDLAEGLTFGTSSRVFERYSLEKEGYPDRMIVLWQEHSHAIDPGEHPTCPSPLGKGWEGITRASLLDMKEKRIVNTTDPIERFGSYRPQGIFPLYIAVRNKGDLPGTFFIKDEEDVGAMTYLSFYDFNDDGHPLEFILYDNEGCAGAAVTVFGYSVKQDKIIRYPIEHSNYLLLNQPFLIELAKEKGYIDAELGDSIPITPHMSTHFWINKTWLWVYRYGESVPERIKKAIRPGYWEFDSDTTGRGGDAYHHQLRYDASLEKFFQRNEEYECASERCRYEILPKK